MSYEYRTMVAYKVISEHDQEVFNQKCGEAINEGWELFGRLHCNNRKDGELMYSQCFGKFEEAKHSSNKSTRKYGGGET